MLDFNKTLWGKKWKSETQYFHIMKQQAAGFSMILIHILTLIITKNLSNQALNCFHQY